MFIISEHWSCSAAQDMLDEEARGKKAMHKVQVIVSARATLGSRLDEIDRRERVVMSRAVKGRASLLAEVDTKRWEEAEKERTEREAREKREREEARRVQQEREEEEREQREARERSRHTRRGGALASAFIRVTSPPPREQLLVRQSEPHMNLFVTQVAPALHLRASLPRRSALTAVVHNRQARSIAQVERFILFCLLVRVVKIRAHWFNSTGVENI